MMRKPLRLLHRESADWQQSLLSHPRWGLRARQINGRAVPKQYLPAFSIIALDAPRVILCVIEEPKPAGPGERDSGQDSLNFCQINLQEKIQLRSLQPRPRQAFGQVGQSTKTTGTNASG